MTTRTTHGAAGVTADALTGAARELNNRVAERDAACEFDRSAWRAAARLGIQALAVGPSDGGSMVDATSTLNSLESLGYVCTDNGLLFSLGAQMWGCQTPLAKFGTPAQKAQYLPGLIDGSIIGALAVTEQDSGSDALSLQTSAKRAGDDFVLTGRKIFVTNAPDARVFVILARTDADAGLFGLSAFLLDRESIEFRVGEPMTKLGLRTAPCAEVELREAVVPADCLLGALGGGWSVFNVAMEAERTFILAPALGTMRRLLESTIEYATRRRQFGATIGSFQSVAHLIAQMSLMAKTSGLVLRDVASQRDNGRIDGATVAGAKFHVSENFTAFCLSALEIFAASAYVEGNEIERTLRDAIASRIYSGTANIQLNIIARGLGL